MFFFFHYAFAFLREWSDSLPSIYLLSLSLSAWPPHIPSTPPPPPLPSAHHRLTYLLNTLSVYFVAFSTFLFLSLLPLLTLTTLTTIKSTSNEMKTTNYIKFSFIPYIVSNPHKRMTNKYLKHRAILKVTATRFYCMASNTILTNRKQFDRFIQPQTDELTNWTNVNLLGSKRR